MFSDILREIGVILLVMIKKYTKMCGFLAVLLINSPTIHAMHAFKSRFKNLSWKSAAAATLAGGCSLAQYGIAYNIYNKLVPTNEALKGLPMYDQEFETLSDVDPIIESFVKQHLHNNGITEQLPLKVKYWNDTTFGAMKTDKYNWIFFPYDEIEILKRSLRSQSTDNNNFSITLTVKDKSIELTALDYLKQSAAIIQHESGHIINNDAKKRKLSILSIPLIVSALSFVIRKKINLPTNYWLKNLSKIVSGVAIGPISAGAFYQYYQLRELKADDMIQNNIHLLEAKKQEMKNHLFLYEDDYKKMAWHKQLLHTHPHPKTRIKRLKHRIQALKQKSDPKAFENPLDSKQQEIK